MANHMDLRAIDKADRRNLANTFLSAAQRFYEDPENVKRFEAWKAERDTRKQ